MTNFVRAGVDDCASGILSEVESAIESPDRWVDEYGDQLFRAAVARVGDRGVAEDLVQETFLAAWKGREAFDGRSALGTWLVAILKRKATDHFRKRGRSPTIESTGEADGDQLFDHRGQWQDRVQDFSTLPESVAEKAEFWEVIAACVEDMPGPLAQAFHLRELESKPPADTCDELGITRKNLSVRMHRARLLLRRCLEGRWFKRNGTEP